MTPSFCTHSPLVSLSSSGGRRTPRKLRRNHPTDLAAAAQTNQRSRRRRRKAAAAVQTTLSEVELVVLVVLGPCLCCAQLSLVTALVTTGKRRGAAAAAQYVAVTHRFPPDSSQIPPSYFSAEENLFRVTLRSLSWRRCLFCGACPAAVVANLQCGLRGAIFLRFVLFWCQINEKRMVSLSVFM